MDFYGIGMILRQVADKYGLLAGLGVLFLLGVAGILLYMGKKYITMHEATTTAKEVQFQSLFSELRAERQQNNTLMTNHIQHLETRQSEDVKFQADIVKTQIEMTKALEEHLDLLRDLRGKHEDMGNQLSRIEGKIA